MEDEKPISRSGAGPPTPWLTALTNRANGTRSNQRAANQTFQAVAEEQLVYSKSYYDEKYCIPPNSRSTFLMVFSPDGKLMASGHGDHNVYISDLATRACLRTLPGHPRTPWCLAFHPNSSQLLASGCLGGQVRVWDLSGGSEVWNTEEPTMIASVAFHPTSERLLVIATYNEVYFWDWSQPKPFAKCCTRSEKERIRYISFDPRGHKLITGIANRWLPVSQWDICSGPVFLSRAPTTSVSAGIRDFYSQDTPPPRSDGPAASTSRAGGSSSTSGEEPRPVSSLLQEYEGLMQRCRRLIGSATDRPPPLRVDRGTNTNSAEPRRPPWNLASAPGSPSRGGRSYYMQRIAELERRIANSQMMNLRERNASTAAGSATDTSLNPDSVSTLGSATLASVSIASASTGTATTSVNPSSTTTTAAANQVPRVRPPGIPTNAYILSSSPDFMPRVERETVSTFNEQSTEERIPVEPPNREGEEPEDGNAETTGETSTTPSSSSAPGTSSAGNSSSSFLRGRTFLCLRTLGRKRVSSSAVDPKGVIKRVKFVCHSTKKDSENSHQSNGSATSSTRGASNGSGATSLAAEESVAADIPETTGTDAAPSTDSATPRHAASESYLFEDPQADTETHERAAVQSTGAASPSESSLHGSSQPSSETRGAAIPGTSRSSEPSETSLYDDPQPSTSQSAPQLPSLVLSSSDSESSSSDSGDDTGPRSRPSISRQHSLLTMIQQQAAERERLPRNRNSLQPSQQSAFIVHTPRAGLGARTSTTSRTGKTTNVDGRRPGARNTPAERSSMAPRFFRADLGVRYAIRLLSRHIDLMERRCRARLEILQLEQIRRLWEEFMRQLTSLNTSLASNSQAEGEERTWSGSSRGAAGGSDAEQEAALNEAYQRLVARTNLEDELLSSLAPPERPPARASMSGQVPQDAPPVELEVGSGAAEEGASGGAAGAERLQQAREGSEEYQSMLLQASQISVLRRLLSLLDRSEGPAETDTASRRRRRAEPRSESPTEFLEELRSLQQSIVERYDQMSLQAPSQEAMQRDLDRIVHLELAVRERLRLSEDDIERSLLEGVGQRSPQRNQPDIDSPDSPPRSRLQNARQQLPRPERSETSSRLDSRERMEDSGFVPYWMENPNQPPTLEPPVDLPSSSPPAQATSGSRPMSPRSRFIESYNRQLFGRRQQADGQAESRPLWARATPLDIGGPSSVYRRAESSLDRLDFPMDHVPVLRFHYLIPLEPNGNQDRPSDPRNVGRRPTGNASRPPLRVSLPFWLSSGQPASGSPAPADGRRPARSSGPPTPSESRRPATESRAPQDSTEDWTNNSTLMYTTRRQAWRVLGLMVRHVRQHIELHQLERHSEGSALHGHLQQLLSLLHRALELTDTLLTQMLSTRREIERQWQMRFRSSLSIRARRYYRHAMPTVPSSAPPGAPAQPGSSVWRRREEARRPDLPDMTDELAPRFNPRSEVEPDQSQRSQQLRQRLGGLWSCRRDEPQDVSSFSQLTEPVPDSSTEPAPTPRSEPIPSTSGEPLPSTSAADGANAADEPEYDSEHPDQSSLYDSIRSRYNRVCNILDRLTQLDPSPQFRSWADNLRRLLETPQLYYFEAEERRQRNEQRQPPLNVPSVHINDVPVTDTATLNQQQSRIPAPRISPPRPADSPEGVPMEEIRLLRQRTPSPVLSRSRTGPWRSWMYYPRTRGGPASLYPRTLFSPFPHQASMENIRVGAIPANATAPSSCPTAATHRIQCWPFLEEGEPFPPDISDPQRNLVVAHCRINNATSLEVSPDGTYVVALVSPPRPEGYRIGIFSLERATLGQVLFMTPMEMTPVSVSLSPSRRFLLVGLASKRFLTVRGEAGPTAQVFRIPWERRGSGSSATVTPPSLQALRFIYHNNETSQMAMMNCIRWAPESGQGIVYGTNGGVLGILR